MNTLRAALYYPYIHIRSEHWLKATLLCMPSVKRIVPENYTPEDPPNIIEYTRITGPNGELLQTVPAYSPAAEEAQDRLYKKLVEHAETINGTYDRTHAPSIDEYWIHSAKFTDGLLKHLTKHNLAWQSVDPNAFGTRTWHALHPVLGKAIMTTLGLSIAREQHYDIVTADGKYHEALLATTEQDIFDTLLGNTPAAASLTGPQIRNDLAHLVVNLTGVNYQALRPQSIPELQASTHFQEFQRVLRLGASTIDHHEDDPDAYRQQLKEEAEHIISTWQDIKLHVGTELRDALFETGLTLGADALKMAVKGHDMSDLVVGGGVVVYQLITKGRRLIKQLDNPYQYLTQIERAQKTTFFASHFPSGCKSSALARNSWIEAPARRH